MFNELKTPQELQALRDDYAAHVRAEQVETEPALPLPPATPPGLTDLQKAVLADNWVADIQTRRSDSWTDLEKAAVRAAISRALKTL
jgi:hypothetical protein